MEAAQRLTSIEGGAGQFPESLLSQVTILNERPGGLLEAMVPSHLINREEVPVDEEHVDQLAHNMLAERAKGNGTGQLSPILLGEVPGLPSFLIADGFHRDATLFKIGENDIFSTIKPNCSQEEVLDLRIITATMHSSVTFARVVEWIGDAWQKTPWADKITAIQAFSLTSPKITGRNMGLSQIEAEAIKAWAYDKSNKWSMAPATIKTSLLTASMSDPELVKEARRRPGGHALTEITPQHLGVLAKGFPHRHAEQQFIAAIAKANNFNVPKTRAAVEALKSAKDLSEMQELAKHIDWAMIQPLSGEKQAKSEVPSPPSADTETSAPDSHRPGYAKYPEVVAAFVASEIELAKLSLENILLRGKYTPARVQLKEAGLPPQLVVTDAPRLQTVDWGDDRLDAVLDKIEAAKEPTVMKLVATGISLPEATTIFSRVGMRISQDIEEGALKYADVDESMVLSPMFRQTLRDEVGLHHGKKRTTIAPHEASQKDFEVSDTVDIKLVHMLANLEPIERRILILGGVYRLTPFIIRQLVSVDESHVNFRYTSIATSAKGAFA